jgi:hypothetical protein
MRDKHALTHWLLQQLPQQHRIEQKQALVVWWHNIRRTGGLRLTDQGFQTLAQVLELDHYRIELGSNYAVTNRLIVKLDRVLQMPYYVDFDRTKKTARATAAVVFFGSKEAMMARLYGDIDRFLYCYG